MSEHVELTEKQLEGAIEALLFVSDEPVSAVTLSRFLGQTPQQIDAVLTRLTVRYQDEERGIQLREVAGGWRLYWHPAYHEFIEQYVISWDTRSLSQAALEALAVIAYHQPTTRAGVNGIRGVNSDAVISSLIEKGLVREAGRDSGPGNAILYATTRTFLEKFGLKSLRELPPLEDFAPDEQSKAFIRSRLSAHRLNDDDLEEGVEEQVGYIETYDDENLEEGVFDIVGYDAPATPNKPKGGIDFNIVGLDTPAHNDASNRDPRFMIVGLDDAQGDDDDDDSGIEFID